ncbi:SGNH/GDSL hydrolase family protein [Actinoplanes sp. NPDC049596]|uniref:SGNH/GDSL hydrolase family protein n=1 Tax=unclassified Actinoplanes TaxID=2626549 RepID=UPI00342270F9
MRPLAALLLRGPAALLRLRPAAALLLLGLAACGPAGTPSVVTLGDSVAAGAACGCQPFPALYASAQHATNVDLAQSGADSADVRALVPLSKPALAAAAEVVIMVGANDMAADFEKPASYPSVAAAVRTNVTATITAIEQIHHVRVIVLGYWNVVLDGRVAATKYGPTGVRASLTATDTVNEALRTAAQQTGARYVPTAPAFHGPDGTQDPTGSLAPDGDHPNANGQAAIAALIPPLP